MERLQLVSVELLWVQSLQPWSGHKQANGQAMLSWLQQIFVGEEDCLTNRKNVCVGGYDNEWAPILISYN